MKLSYRGISYDFNPSSLQARGAKHRLSNAAQAKTLGAILTYRGAAFTIAPFSQTEPAHVNVAAGKVLTYRGIRYTVQPSLSVAPTEAVAPVKASVRSIADQARTLTMNHHRAAKKRQQVMLVRSAADVGQSVTAASQWQSLQETFNPVFQATYDRSHVALS
ncbi:MAG: DUF4278 domain-containing protein [Stenomitos frigidus ULC029]